MSLYLVFLTDITRETGLTRERRMTAISYLTSHSVYTEKVPEFVMLRRYVIKLRARFRAL